MASGSSGNVSGQVQNAPVRQAKTFDPAISSKTQWFIYRETRRSLTAVQLFPPECEEDKWLNSNIYC